MLTETPLKHLFHLSPTIEYGPGASDRVGDALRELGARRVLVVTDEGLLRAGVCERVEHLLVQAGLDYVVHCDVETNPSDQHVATAVSAYREQGTDALLGLGGGSPMDVAKSAALVISNGGSIHDYEDGRKPVTRPSPPLVLVPTTAGTGSEVVGGTIIIDSARVFKMHIVAVPCDVALCDPLLTVTLPPLPTAASGLDALAHAIGAFVSSERQPLTDAMALYAMSTIRRWLPEVIRDGSNLEARHQMMLGSISAGISMKGGAAVDHAFGHALNAMFGVLHGVGVALFLPAAMEFNLAYLPDRLARVGAELGVDASGRDVNEIAAEGIEVVRDLIEHCAIPSLMELGVHSEHVPALVDKVMEDRFHIGLNPVEVTAADAEEILARVLERQGAVR